MSLLFIIVLDALSREIGFEYPQELFYAGDLSLVRETLEDVKARLERYIRV